MWYQLLYFMTHGWIWTWFQMWSCKDGDQKTMSSNIKHSTSRKLHSDYNKIQYAILGWKTSRPQSSKLIDLFVANCLVLFSLDMFLQHDQGWEAIILFFGSYKRQVFGSFIANYLLPWRLSLSYYHSSTASFSGTFLSPSSTPVFLLVLIEPSCNYIFHLISLASPLGSCQLKEAKRGMLCTWS